MGLQKYAQLFNFYMDMYANNLGKSQSREANLAEKLNLTEFIEFCYAMSEGAAPFLKFHMSKGFAIFAEEQWALRRTHA